jgi:2-polyprenyl-6-hydroxyphenyl methylase/3-demethylubiquinone-9 3-methyltransferase
MKVSIHYWCGYLLNSIHQQGRYPRIYQKEIQSQSLKSDMTRKKLKTLHCNSENEILEFFEKSARDYQEAHGNADQLLKYRMSKFIEWGNLNSDDVVLDVGCGNGHHLYFLAPYIKSGMGVDFSEKMIESAQKALQNSPYSQKLQFQVDNARYLKTIPDESVDVVMCVGSYEHMPDKETVTSQFYRVLKQGGRLVLMTPNGGYIWYRFLAPLFNYPTKHLSTDQFLTVHQLQEKLLKGKFSDLKMGYWKFIPRGDMSRPWGIFLEMLEVVGGLLKIGRLRGGLIISGVKN